MRRLIFSDSYLSSNWEWTGGWLEKLTISSCDWREWRNLTVYIEENLSSGNAFWPIAEQVKVKFGKKLWSAVDE